MLKADPKIWAIVLIVCLIGQFLFATIPAWSEENERESAGNVSERVGYDRGEDVRSSEIVSSADKDARDSEEDSGLPWWSIVLVVIVIACVIISLVEIGEYRYYC